MLIIAHTHSITGDNKSLLHYVSSYKPSTGIEAAMENTNKKYGKESKLKLSRHADENNNDDIASVGETHYFDILNGISCVSFQKRKRPC